MNTFTLGKLFRDELARLLRLPERRTLWWIMSETGSDLQHIDPAGELDQAQTQGVELATHHLQRPPHHRA
jgi:hypothetical protein